MDVGELEVVADREYRDANGRAVVVKIGKPRPDPRPGGQWECPYALVLADEPARVREIFGEDALQALLLALKVLKAELEYLDRIAGPLTFDGEPGLWLDFLESPSPRAHRERPER